MISLTIPLRTVSEANAHTHWRTRQKRAKGQREAAWLCMLSEAKRAWEMPPRLLLDPKYRFQSRSGLDVQGGPLAVTLTRIAPRSLDSDNLAGSQKHVRDGVADALGIDDRDPRVTWAYAQEKGKPGFYGVRIEIRRAT